MDIDMNFRQYEKIINDRFEKQILEYKLIEYGEYLELFSIAIKPAWRGQGWGSAFIEDLIEFAKEQGYAGIQLQCDHKTKHQLVPFYQTFGFVSIDDDLQDFMRIYFNEEKKND